MPLSAKTKLGPYEIQSQLGAGGMGEVYRARDTRLERTVAIKVLPPSVATDTDRLLRFEQEARVLSTLNHPNLMAIYDVGAQDGVHYLVSEFLEGETLRERIGGGALPQRKAVEYGLQIADALGAAHNKGIVHRDLKPENIFVTRDEHVKLLDFGLAKQQNLMPDEAATLSSPARPSPTGPGTVLGTVGYMSPEQVRGEAADHRSDIFSFGAILYEMVVGRRAFKGDSSVATLNAILREEPPEIEVGEKKVSPGVERIIRHCLEKKAADRFQSARDLAFALSALSGSETTAAVRPIAPGTQWNRVAAWAAASVALLVLGGALGSVLSKPKKPAAEAMEFAIPVDGEVNHLAISADGRMLAYVSPDDATGAYVVHVQKIGSRNATVLAGTEGASYPFWSPDDAYVGFFAGGKLKKVAATGGTTQAIALAAQGRGASWGSKGVIVFQPELGGALWRVNPDGSKLEPLNDVVVGGAEVSHRWPAFLPDGDHFLFWAGNFSNLKEDRVSGIYLASISSKGKQLILLSRSNPGYGGGQLFYVDERRALNAVALDISSGKMTGEVRAVAEAVGYQASTYWGAFTVSDEGTLVYNTSNGAVLSALIWRAQTGKQLAQLGEPGVLANPTISPDGERVVVDTTDTKANNVDLWIHNLRTGTRSRFTFDPSEEAGAAWSRDGETIAFRSTADPAGTRVHTKKANGREADKIISEPVVGSDLIPNSWSLDDTKILCTSQPRGRSSDLVIVAAKGGPMVPFVATPASETSGQISPDGKWVAYASNESGDWEIYATTFPDAAGKWQVSRGGGTEPRWSGDGKEIFYLGSKNMLTAVPVNTEGTFSAGTPVTLFQVHGRAPISSTDLYTYDVTKDGKRFLVNTYLKPEHIPPLHVVLNSGAEARK